MKQNITVGTVQNITLSEQFKISHCRNSSKYHTVGTVQNITLSEQFKISHCRNSSKYHTVGTVLNRNRKITETRGNIYTLNTYT